uniref:Velvet domain-containing protein n=1 Tax=Elaeophora elaphi TaxID=1147741 RepID=A0A0R3RPU6_9BILA
MNTAPTMPVTDWLLSQGFSLSPPTPQRFPIVPSNHTFQPVHRNEDHLRRRRPIRIRELNPVWMPRMRNDQSFITINNTVQSTATIVSVVDTDPTGGSKIVTRRRQDGQMDVRIIYSREFIVDASASPYALLPPANFRQMIFEMMEIVTKFPTSYHNSIRPNSS